LVWRRRLDEGIRIRTRIRRMGDGRLRMEYGR